MHNIDLDVCWIPREENKEADRLSKQVNYGDRFTTNNLVKMLTYKWGKISIDLLVKPIRKLNYKYICAGSEGVNSYSVVKSSENNLFIHTVYLIPKTVKHFMSSKYSSKVILMCSYWPSPTFWPLLFEADGEFQSFINPLVPNVPFLYPLKTSENLTVFWCFQGVEKWCIGNEWVKDIFFILNVPKYIKLRNY